MPSATAEKRKAQARARRARHAADPNSPIIARENERKVNINLARICNFNCFV